MKDLKARIVAGFALLAVAGMGIAACSSTGNPSGASSEAQSSANDLTTFQQAQPAPHFPYSVIRQAMVAVEASQALGEQTTSFFFNMGSNAPMFQCPSIGQPIPNTAQLTNPQQVIHDGYPNGGAALTIGNIDPNGIYTPANSSGTNVMCINGAGQQYLAYWEGFVFAVNGAATWDPHGGPSGTGGIVVTGQPSMPTCKVESKTVTHADGTTGTQQVNVCTK